MTRTRDVAAVVVFLLMTRTAPSAQDAGGPTFEVASVRRNTSSEGRTLMDGSGGRYTVTNATLRMLILNAYELQDSQLVGPDWIDSTRYDIQASRGGAPFDQVPAMMRALLADRFKLKAHIEPREMARYSLTLARSDGRLGPQIKSAACEGRVREGTGFPKPGETMLCGTQFFTTRPGGPWNIRVGGKRLRDLASLLTPYAGRIVVDRTGLDGLYDIDLTWTPDLGQSADAAARTDAGVSLFTAVQEQLGLRLAGDRGPVDVLVIDSISEPTAN